LNQNVGKGHRIALGCEHHWASSVQEVGGGKTKLNRGDKRGGAKKTKGWLCPGDQGPPRVDKGLKKWTNKFLVRRHCTGVEKFIRLKLTGAPPQKGWICGVGMWTYRFQGSRLQKQIFNTGRKKKNSRDDGRGQGENGKGEKKGCSSEKLASNGKKWEFSGLVGNTRGTKRRNDSKSNGNFKECV